MNCWLIIINCCIMKKILFLSLMLFSVSLMAQPGEHHCKKREQLKAQKVAFLTERLNLSVEEAQKFWPVYNEFNAKVDEYDKEKRQIMKKYETEKDQLSDKEITEMYVKLIELETKELKATTEFRKEMKNILSIRKMMELQTAERMFKHELLNKIKHCGPGMPPE